MRSSIIAAFAALAMAAACARADEGMWTFQNFPAASVASKYGVEITPQWLERVRLATVRLTDCTASFVSPDGLILTNHHCAQACLEEHSTRDRNLVDSGYLADSRARELRCGAQYADVLVSMEDVTAQVRAAMRGLDPRAANEHRRQTLTQLEQACEAGSRSDPQTAPLKCEAVDLYQGGLYYLYKYERYHDVRLVFAPENDIAAFGGDPDNFEFPRWCLDMAFLRAYVGGKPAHTPQHLAIDFTGPKAGEPIFVSGHPGSTERELTTAQLITQRDAELPPYLLRASELRGRYIQFGVESEAARRLVETPLTFLENRLKVRRIELDALHDDAQLARKRAGEAALEQRIAAQPALQSATGDPWSDIERAESASRRLSLRYDFLEGGAGFDSRLFRYARALVRAAEEREKPDAARLREYTSPRLAALEQQIEASVPVHPELERITLSLGLARMQEWLGPDDPIVRRVLGTDSPYALADRLTAESGLADPAVRRELWQGGSRAIAGSHDAMIELARLVDPDARTERRRYEETVEAPERDAAARLAHARFAVLGTSVYPDANFTLRLSYGTVRGWTERGEPIAPFTRLERLYKRATGAEPFRLPESWIAARGRLDPTTPFNFCTDNDIVGGNSGSPALNARGEIVGLMFDGNIHSIAGAYWFDEDQNRAVAVDTAIMFAALRDVYRADALLAELGQPIAASLPASSLMRRPSL
ncbi:MAG TPA: S46 family peptidase [Steroidobacteraceae bacterium]|nr:S46 family peptidase [Steroidobacteraceae bacterium]